MPVTSPVRMIRGLTEVGKIPPQVNKALQKERKMPPGRIRLFPELRFEDIERQNGPAAQAGAFERGVILYAKIFLEPDDLHVCDQICTCSK